MLAVSVPPFFPLSPSGQHGDSLQTNREYQLPIGSISELHACPEQLLADHCLQVHVVVVWLFAQ